MSSDLAAKRLELLKQVSPNSPRVAVLFKPDEPSTGPELRQPETAARAMGVTLQRLDAQSANDLYGWREFVDAGGLVSYGPNLQTTIRRSATFVDRILKGAKPTDLPIEQPTSLELVVNAKTAKALGLTIPQTLLLRADQVIE
jgi:putative tryptophan/tyrosine transport system substrate-binding protein